MTLITTVATILFVSFSAGMVYAFDNRLYSIGFICIYGLISFFTIAVVSFRIDNHRKQTQEKYND